MNFELLFQLLDGRFMVYELVHYVEIIIFYMAISLSVSKWKSRFLCFKVDGYPVYSMATPTIAGAEEMLAYLGAKPTAEGSSPQKVVLTDLREEAVVYINNTPFVLRELNKPVDTLKHIGITGQVVCSHCQKLFTKKNCR